MRAKEAEDGGPNEAKLEMEVTQATNKVFKYRKNLIYEDLLQQEKHKEAMIVLQCFRYFV